MLSGRCPVRGPVPPVRAGEAGEGRAALCLVASVPLVVAAGPCIRGWYGGNVWGAWSSPGKGVSGVPEGGPHSLGTVVSTKPQRPV